LSSRLTSKLKEKRRGRHGNGGRDGDGSWRGGGGTAYGGVTARQVCPPLGWSEELVAGKRYHSNEVAVRLGELEVRAYMRCMAIGGALGDNRASDCNGSAGRRSNGTWRIRSNGRTGTAIRPGDWKLPEETAGPGAACNLARLMRSMYEARKPGADHDQEVEADFVILSLINALSAASELWYGTLAVCRIKRKFVRT